MSRMQDALFRKDYECAKPAMPVAEICDDDTQEPSDKSYQGNALRKSDQRQLGPRPILWIVPNTPAESDRPAAERTSPRKSTRVGRTSARHTRKRSEGRRAPALRNESVAGQPQQKEDESIAAQILRFQERADLRACLLPGMLGRISRKACEGWQRQASVRNSRMLAKIKLESCKNCQYAIKPVESRP